LTPGQRHTYLRWMAEGRRTLPPEDGYLFIFYYGLERRALVGKHDTERILGEVEQLRRLHHEAAGRTRSFRRYSSSFVWFLVAGDPRSLPEPSVRRLAQSTHSWSDDHLAAALAWAVANGRSLPTWLAFTVAGQLPGAKRSVVVRRVGDEFQKLFARRYAETYEHGLALETARRERVLTYQPASAALSPLSIRIPNALGRSSQFKKLSAIWNGCIDDLRRYSRSGGREGEELTASAWAALPDELRAGIDHPLTPAVCGLVDRHAHDKGYAIVSAGDTAQLVGLEFRNRLTPKQSRDVVETFQHVGYAIEPDTRLTRRSYRWEERFTVFLRVYDDPVDPVRYTAAACLLKLGLHVAQADGTVDEGELALITAHIAEAFDLNEHECRRIEALRHLLLVEGADIAGIGGRIADVIPETRRVQVGRLLVAVAAADGTISRSEITALRRCFRALALKPDVLEAALAELAPDSDETTVVIEGRTLPRRPGERIAPPPRTDDRREGISLDRAKIAAILTETHEVATLLAQAMNLEEAEPDVAVVDVTPAEQDAPTDGPPRRYAGFYTELIAAETWSEDELLLHAALEEINDWAFDALGGPVAYQEGGQLEIDHELIRDAQGDT
jgi:uncharacterized tellurite resistance protein B-like protein